MAGLRLQVCICTIGSEGMRRMARLGYPRVEGVEHVIFLQEPDSAAEVPAELLARGDFRVVRSRTRGIARNRNLALQGATAPVAMITDDDVSYTAADYERVIEAFAARPEMDVASFRFRSAAHQKRYPAQEFDWRRPAKGYYLTAFEVALRPERVRGRVSYNEHFGIATDFLGGEDDLFLLDAPRAGLNCRFLPLDCGRHDHATTASRHRFDPRRIETKGAIISRAHPLTWPVRLLLHAIRESCAAEGLSAPRYAAAWLRGIRKARRLNVFGAP